MRGCAGYPRDIRVILITSQHRASYPRVPTSCPALPHSLHSCWHPLCPAPGPGSGSPGRAGVSALHCIPSGVPSPEHVEWLTTSGANSTQSTLSTQSAPNNARLLSRAAALCSRTTVEGRAVCRPERLCSFSACNVSEVGAGRGGGGEVVGGVARPPRAAWPPTRRPRPYLFRPLFKNPQLPSWRTNVDNSIHRPRRARRAMKTEPKSRARPGIRTGG